MAGVMADITIGRLRGGFCVYWTGADGKRSRHQLKSRSRKEAEAEARDVYLREVARPGAFTVAEVWAAYVADRAGRPIATTMGYTGKAILPFFGAMRPDQITTEDCRAYLARRRAAGIKDGSVWTELGHLRISMTWAVKARLIKEAPPIERPHAAPPKERYLTRAEIDRLLAAPCQPHIRIAILLMLSTAARVSAILELTWDRVDMERGQIRLRADPTGPKKGRATVPINAGLRAALVVAKEAALSDHVVEWSGGPVGSIQRGFASAVKAAGLANVSPHVLRHSSAVHMVEAGIPIDEVAQYLGHSSPRVTFAVYGRYSPDHLRTAADVLDFTKIRAVKGAA
jgi:integrase